MGELMQQTLILSPHYKGQMKDTDPGVTSGNNRLFQNFPGAAKCKLEYDRVSRGGVLRYSKRGLDPPAELGQTAVEAQARAARAPECVESAGRQTVEGCVTRAAIQELTLRY